MHSDADTDGIGLSAIAMPAPLFIEHAVGQSFSM
jgi:hypothetical protein